MEDTGMGGKGRSRGKNGKGVGIGVKEARERGEISRAALGKFAVDVQSSTKQFLYHIIQMIIIAIITIIVIFLFVIIIIIIKYDFA